jgi:hypothetical protein
MPKDGKLLPFAPERSPLSIPDIEERNEPVKGKTLEAGGKLLMSKASEFSLG